METSHLCLSFFYTCFLLSSGYTRSEGSALHREQQIADHGFRPTKLFVFGDSYADTGNLRKSIGSSWNEPYGTTFPGKPRGRYSDGRILTDYIAKFLGLKSPVAYEWMKLGGKKVRWGMNFAYGGSGVFNTLADIFPNMSTQIGFFENLMHRSLFTPSDLQSSFVLVSLAGNDYGAFLAQGGTMQDLQKFIPRVVTQLGANLRRLRQLGATKVAVTSLEPLGCLPRITVDSSYQHCNTTENSAVGYHNLLLQQAVAELNNGSSSASTFFIIDLYTSFTTVLAQKGDYQGNLKFSTPLKPCCVGENGYFCGGVDGEGVKMYRVCSDPTSAFFWDTSHPTDAGWHAVYTTFKPSLEQFLNFNNTF